MQLAGESAAEGFEETRPITTIPVPVTQATSPPLSFYDVFKMVTIPSLWRAGSFTFSMYVFLLIALLTYKAQNENEVAAAALIGAVVESVAVMGLAPLFAIGIIISRLLGELENIDLDDIEARQSKKKEIALVYSLGVVIAAGMSSLAILAFLNVKKILVNILGQNEEVAEIVQEFCNNFVPALPPILLRIASEQVLFSFGYEKAVMAMAFSIFLVTASLTTWVTLSDLIVPAQRAVAWGGVADSYLIAISVTAFLVFYKEFRTFPFLRYIANLRETAKQFGELVYLGASIFAGMFVEVITPLLNASLAGRVSTSAQAAWNATTQLSAFSLIISRALSLHLSQLVSYYLGTRRYENTRNLAIYGSITTMLVLSPISVIVEAFPGVVTVTLDEAYKDLLPTARNLVRFAGALILAEALRFCILVQSRPLGDKTLSTIISSFFLGVGVFFSYLGIKMGLGVYGVMLGALAGTLLAALFLSLRFKTLTRVEHMRAEIESKHDVSVTSKVTDYMKHMLWGPSAATQNNTLSTAVYADQQQQHSMASYPEVSLPASSKS